jgi:hypothetical protein
MWALISPRVPISGNLKRRSHFGPCSLSVLLIAGPFVVCSMYTGASQREFPGARREVVEGSDISDEEG